MIVLTKELREWVGGANCDDSKRYWFLFSSLFPEILHKAYERFRSRQKREKFSNIWRIFHVPLFNAEAEFVDIIWTKVFPPCYSQSPLLTDSTPTPLSWAEVVWNWFVMSRLYTETSSLRTLKSMPRNLNEIVRSRIRLLDRFPKI